MSSSLFSLRDRIVLVTGASRGLGRAMAAAMAEAGAHVVLNGRDRAALDAAAGAIRDAGGAADTMPFDVTDETAATAAVDEIVRRHGRLDVLVANAGMTFRRPLAEFSTADWNSVLGTDLTACFTLSREAAKHMIPRRSGRIVMVASIIGTKVARPTIPAYAAAKAGLAGLTKALAVELGPHGITCNAIAPGYFATEINTTLVQDPTFNGMVTKRTPLGRWGEPKELGGTAIFLASDAGSYVNGHVLTVDGGLTAAL